MTTRATSSLDLRGAVCGPILLISVDVLYCSRYDRQSDDVTISNRCTSARAYLHLFDRYGDG